jgi:hypothetical protein
VTAPPVRQPLYRILVAVTLGAATSVLGAGTAGASRADPSPLVTIAAVSGQQGHAFVYAQVSDLLGAHPAPPGTSPTPYYSRWEAVPMGTVACPWLWLIYVYDRATNRQLNAPPAGLPTPFPTTTTFFCPSPTVSPVAGPRLAIAQARLDLDLALASAPARPAAGSPVAISGRLTGQVTDDVGLLLSMAIADWRVDGWRVDFGDGSRTIVPGGPAPTISTTHVYDSGGVYPARVIASISGTAQAAEYGASGYPFLVRRAFSVQVSNGRSISVGGGSTRHVPPIVAAAVSPTIHGSGAPDGPGLRRIEVPRAELIDLYLRPLIVREGYRTLGGSFAGWARSRVVAWRYAAAPGPAPDRVLPDAGWLQAGAPLDLQWNAPDPVYGARPQDYVIGLQLRIEVRYPDGVTTELTVPATVDATVRYAAQNE